jgi:DNA-binding GntR family transcriptional regulator
MIVADRAYAELRARIIDLRLRPGQIVSELSLAAELGVARSTIHDALVRLQDEELVEPLPRRGYCVTVPTAEALRETYEIVGALEGIGVRRAARERGPILLAALAAAVEMQASALAANDLDTWAHGDYRFHQLVREAAGNRRLREIIGRYNGQLHRARIATLHLRPGPRLSTDDHREILEAIRAGDEDAAVRIHAAHRRRADAEMLAAIRRFVKHPDLARHGDAPSEASAQHEASSEHPSTAVHSGITRR